MSENLTPDQVVLWNDIEALHKAWIDRGVLVRDVVSLVGAYLANIAVTNNLSPSYVLQLFGASYGKLMEIKLNELPPSKL